MKKLMISAAALAISGSAAVAGGYVAPIETTPVVIDTPVIAPALNWSGFYAGAQAGRFSGDLSQNDVDTSVSANGYGLHAGYLHDLGNFVLGGELAYDRLSGISVGDVDLDNDGNRISARAIAGYDMGRVMPYATLGLARLSLDEGNGSVNSNGHLYGIGAKFLATDNLMVGAEVTHQRYKDFGDVDGRDLSGTNVGLSLSYKF